MFAMDVTFLFLRIKHYYCFGLFDFLSYFIEGITPISFAIGISFLNKLNKKNNKSF